MAHTKGPWTAEVLESGHRGYPWRTYTVRAPDNVCLAVVGEVDRLHSEDSDANARLIAAAPDLLAACERMLEAFTVAEDDWPDKGGSFDCTIYPNDVKCVRDALRRAREGDTPATYVDGTGRTRKAGVCAMCGDPLGPDEGCVTVDSRFVCDDCADGTV